MRCVTPMFRRYELGNYKKGTIVPRTEVLDSLNYDPNYIQTCLDKINYMNPKYKYELIPCGHCYACSLNSSAEWATRIMFEAKKYECNFWITLTYDDEHLPIATKMTYGEKTFENYGDEIWLTGTLVPEDITKFLKSLRKSYERKGHKGIKFYLCGEYGEKGKRPHYHIVLMNLPLDITQFYDSHIDTNYKAHWKSHEIEKYWDKGIIDICELEWSDAAYTARYCAKKLFKQVSDEQYAANGKVPEFVRMSNGIGKDYFLENKEKIIRQDGVVAKTVKGSVTKVKMPRYYLKMIEKENPELFYNIKKSRKHLAERSRDMDKKLSDYTDREKMIMDAQRIMTKSKLLPRGGEF